MILGMAAKKLIPIIMGQVLKKFKGIDKIEYLVKYMEDDNDADKAVKYLTDEIDNLKDVISGLKSRIKELENGNK